jgi:hypothetical protein
MAALMVEGRRLMSSTALKAILWVAMVSYHSELLSILVMVDADLVRFVPLHTTLLHASCAGDAWRHPVGILLLSAILLLCPRE